jgi:phage shock protein E
MKRYIIFLFLGIIILLTGCTNNNNAESTNMEQDFKSVNVQEAKVIIDENKYNEDFVIIDVRSPQEYNDGHVENSVMIDFYDTDFRDKLSQLDKEKTYLIYCRSGSRSGRAFDIMEELGFIKVYNFEGGIVEWKKNYDVVTE